MTNKSADALGLVQNWWGPVSAILAVTIFLWQSSISDGWFEATFGKPAPAFWTIVAVWLVFSAVSVRKRQHWWVIPTAPFALSRIAAVALLAVACARGNCL